MRVKTIVEAFSKDVISMVGDRITSIIWFGSTARGGDEAEFSDIDIAIISTDEDKDLWDNIMTICAKHSLRHDRVISIILISESRFARMKRVGRLLARNLERDGVPFLLKTNKRELRVIQ